MPVSVRPARIDDARDIAEVHVAVWRTAYVGLVPQSVLDGLSVDRREAMWRGILGAPERGRSVHVAVAESGRVAGFAATKAANVDANVGPNVGELSAIYVESAIWGTGVGQSLHDAAIRTLAEDGFTSAVLAVLDGNVRARRFYERNGWRADGTRGEFVIAGVALADVKYVRAL